jgi:hypothetical protein
MVEFNSIKERLQAQVIRAVMMASCIIKFNQHMFAQLVHSLVQQLDRWLSPALALLSHLAQERRAEALWHVKEGGEELKGVVDRLKADVESVQGVIADTQVGGGKISRAREVHSS